MLRAGRSGSSGPAAPAVTMSFFPELYFNVDNGYLEGLVRGLKAGVLSQADYLNLVQCETLEGEPRGRVAGPRKAGREAGAGLKVLRSGSGSWGFSKVLRGRGTGSGPERPAGNPGANGGCAGREYTSICGSVGAQTQTTL